MKKTNKKVKPVVKNKSVAEKTGASMKKVGKKVAKVIKKEWKDSEPRREEYKKDIKKVAKKAGVKGKALLKSDLKNSIKIGGDVFDVIKKDIKEIRNEGKK